MKRPIMLVLVLVALLLAVACSSESKQNQSVATKTDSGASTAPPASEAAKRDNALVRVINTIPGNKSFDVYADDQKIFGAIPFKDVTPYKELSVSRHSFRLRTAGQSDAQPLAENSEGLSGGRHYTIVVMPGANGQASMYVLNDNLTTASDDVAKVRVINASPDAGELNVVEKQQNKELFSGVNFESGTSYASVNPMSTTLEVRQEGQDKPIVTVPNAKFEKGKYYTIVVAGNLKGGPAIQTLMVEDQLGTSTTPSTAS
jgi:Domain of unknown function (DUF4397)